MRISFLFLLFFATVYANAQSGDFIILKKKGKTVNTFYSGSQIEFVTDAGAYRNAVITEIKHDSIFLREYIINRIPTTLGFFIIDTAGSYHYLYNYRQIRTFGKENKNFDIHGSGAALFGGGIVITLASSVVYLADKEKFSPALLAAGAGLGIAGYFMSKAGSKGITIGKKGYTLEYMNMNPKN